MKLPRRFPLLPRKKNTDKKNYGHVLVLAGSRGMTGAAVLCSQAALKSGSGLVTLGMPSGLESAVSRTLVEVMKLPLPQTRRGALSRSSDGPVMAFIRRRKINALAVGPGLSLDIGTIALVRALVRRSPVPVVLDADGLNSFRGRPELLSRRRSGLILTPHEGEFKRLFSQAAPKDSAGRMALAKKLARFYDVVLVLKGHRTLVTDGQKSYVNHTGNPAMAKGGTGDVLTGMIVSFVGQGLGIFDAAVWAVYFHGRAGDLAVKRTGELGLTAGDLIGYLPKAFAGRK